MQGKIYLNIIRYKRELRFECELQVYISHAQGRRNRTLIGGVYIHIFRFCLTSFFWNKVDFKRS